MTRADAYRERVARRLLDALAPLSREQKVAAVADLLRFMDESDRAAP